MPFDLTVYAKVPASAHAGVRALEAQISDRRRIREALQRRVHKACVAQIGQSWACTTNVFPLKQ